MHLCMMVQQRQLNYDIDELRAQVYDILPDEGDSVTDNETSGNE